MDILLIKYPPRATFFNRNGPQHDRKKLPQAAYGFARGKQKLA